MDEEVLTLPDAPTDLKRDATTPLQGASDIGTHVYVGRFLLKRWLRREREVRDIERDVLE